MDVTIATGSDAFETLATEWDALHTVSSTATPFNSLAYARLWWTHFGANDLLELWTVRDNNALIGIAPFYRTLNDEGVEVLRFVGGIDISDYLDVISAPGRELDVAQALVMCLASCNCCWDLHDMPKASPIREAFLRLAPEYGLPIYAEREEVCPVISLPATWDDYLEQLDGKQRREIRRKLRKAGQEGLVSWHVTPPDGVQEAMPIFLWLHQLSTPAKAAFMTPEMAEFFTELAETFAAKGWLELIFLHVNGEPVASYFGFRFRDTLMLYNSGFDNSWLESLSPGWLLLSYHIEYAIAEGIRRYDFMRGAEEYKFHFGGKSEPVYRLQIGKSHERQLIVNNE
jgi:CelD/BcsL family acetyltransferase involved in cellulose biosynthesis